MQPLDFDTFLKICGITAFFALSSLFLSMMKYFSELQTKKINIENKKLPDNEFRKTLSQLPTCIEHDLKKSNKTDWLKNLSLIGLVVIFAPMIYYICKDIQVSYGKWYVVFISITSYVASFGTLLYLAIVVYRFAALFTRLTKYENTKDLYTYNCKK